MNLFRSELYRYKENIFGRPHDKKGGLVNYKEYYELDKNIKGTDITFKVKVVSIKNVITDCNITKQRHSKNSLNLMKKLEK